MPSSACHGALYGVACAFITQFAGQIAPPASAQAPPAAPAASSPDPAPEWTLSGAFRVRLESIDGQPRVGFNASDDQINIRARIAIERAAGRVRFGGELWDSRVVLTEAGTPITTNEVNTLELVQAYVIADLGPVLGDGSKSSLQLGRFMLNLGSRRLVAADDYRNTTNGYTGARLDLRTAAGATADLIYVAPQRRLPDDRPSLVDGDAVLDREDADTVLYGGIVSLPFGARDTVLQPSWFGFREDDQPDLATRNRQLDTLGLRFVREPARGRIDFDIEAMRQTGSIRASTSPAAPRLNVSAGYLHAEAGYTWDTPWRPRLGVEYDIATGDSPGGDVTRFDTLFGMRRAEIAPSGLYNAVGRANLVSPGLRLEVQPSDRLDAFIGVRGLWLEDPADSFSTSGAQDASGASGRFAGVQLDSRVRYWLIPRRLRLDGHLVLLDKGRFLRAAPTRNTSGDTRYAVIDLTTLF